jgi:hypothetical protein
LRRPLERWKVRAWQRHQLLRPAGKARQARVLLWLLSLLNLARIV